MTVHVCAVNSLEHYTDEPQKGETASLLKPSAVTALCACMCGWVGVGESERMHDCIPRPVRPAAGPSGVPPCSAGRKVT